MTKRLVDRTKNNASISSPLPLSLPPSLPPYLELSQSLLLDESVLVTQLLLSLLLRLQTSDVHLLVRLGGAGLGGAGLGELKEGREREGREEGRVSTMSEAHPDKQRNFEAETQMK